MNNRYTADIMFPTVVVDVDSALGALHRVDGSSTADVSESHADSVFSIEMSRVHPSVCPLVCVLRFGYMPTHTPRRRILYVSIA
jgi:hypothetical protein